MTSKWSAVEHAVCAMLSTLDRDEHHAAVANFVQQEVDASREKLTMGHQQGYQKIELFRE